MTNDTHDLRVTICLAPLIYHGLIAAPPNIICINLCKPNIITAVRVCDAWCKLCQRFSHPFRQCCVTIIASSSLWSRSSTRLARKSQYRIPIRCRGFVKTNSSTTLGSAPISVENSRSSSSEHPSSSRTLFSSMRRVFSTIRRPPS